MRAKQVSQTTYLEYRAKICKSKMHLIPQCLGLLFIVSTQPIVTFLCKNGQPCGGSKKQDDIVEK